MSTGWLLDTNVVSELRKKRADAKVKAWYASVDLSAVWLSVLVIGEIRCGLVSLRRRDVDAARTLERWVDRLEGTFERRLLPVDLAIAIAWGKIDGEFGLPEVDGLLAATALVHDLTLVTRNTKDIARTGVAHVNPFVA